MSPVIHVLAGPNGGGRSSLGGALLRSRGLDYFDPEFYARELAASRRVPTDTVLGDAWKEGVRRLVDAIEGGTSFAIETSLAGTTIPALLALAAQRGFRVQVMYFGLCDVQRHIDRVATRAAHGGIAIGDELLAKRWRRSPENLIGLMPYLDGLRVFDNSWPREAGSISLPPPRELLHLDNGRLHAPLGSELGAMPNWVKPIVEAAIETFGAAAKTADHRSGRK
ncbi:MAG: hypothetical protein ACRER5_16265 [Pseudomonas sp.]